MSRKLDFLIILLILLSFPLFFYKLGQSSLISFDEAWYGDIARNILKTGNFINLSWNGNPYLDHPPAGFWLIAKGQLIFGTNEFGVRFAAALSGLLSMVVVYFLGKELFGRTVGVASALALPSAFWFLFRARSGNLDVILTFFFLLSLLLAVKASRDKRFLVPFSAAAALLFLTKTIVPFTAVPSLLIIFWKSKHTWKDFKWPSLIFCLVFGGWFIYNLLTTPGFINNYFRIGLPGIGVETNYLENFKLIKEYLHSGVGKWFWPGVISIFVGLIFKQIRFYILSIFFLSFFVPFIFSQKGHIWHLIPLHPIMILSFFGVSYILLKKIIKHEVIILSLFLLLVLYVSFLQTRRSWYEFIDVPPFISDEEILGAEAGKYPDDFYIDGDFLPTAIFYSQKHVQQISRDELVSLFESDKSFVLITYQWRLDGAKIEKEKYQILKTDRDKILILKKY